MQFVNRGTAMLSRGIAYFTIQGGGFFFFLLFPVANNHTILAGLNAVTILVKYPLSNSCEFSLHTAQGCNTWYLFNLVVRVTIIIAISIIIIGASSIIAGKSANSLLSSSCIELLSFWRHWQPNKTLSLGQSAWNCFNFDIINFALKNLTNIIMVGGNLLIICTAWFYSCICVLYMSNWAYPTTCGFVSSSSSSSFELILASIYVSLTWCFLCVCVLFVFVFVFVFVFLILTIWIDHCS